MNKESPVYIIVFMAVVCIIFSLSVSAVNYMTLDMLTQNEKLHKNRIIVKAFMLPVSAETPEIYDEIIVKNIKPVTIKTEDSEIEGYININNGDIGFVFRGSGFWDIISGIIVLSGDLEEIRNIQILEQKETPGLGARIEEPWFTDQFKGIKINTGDAEAKHLTLDQSSADENNRINAVTGATQTSISLVSIINHQLNFFIIQYNKMKAGL